MAGWPGRVYQDEQGIAVAIVADVAHVLYMAGCAAFVP